MINFRYHVVSLTAVFLALAIGLVVGTAALNGPAADALNDRVNALSRQNQQYRDQVSHLEEEANKQEQFANEAAPTILAGKLTNRKVLVVSMSAASRYVADVVKNLQTAGAKVTTQLEVQDKFADPGNNEELLDLAHQQSGQTGVTGLPTNSNGVETSTALLAAVLMVHAPPVLDRAPGSVLAAYSERGYVIVTGQPTGPADAVVFLAGPPYVDREANRKNAAVLTMADQLDQAGRIVVAGNGTGGDVVASLRGDPTLNRTVSTVDNLATAQGRIAIALAVAEQFEEHAGHYGIGGGATSLMPKPASQ